MFSDSPVTNTPRLQLTDLRGPALLKHFFGHMGLHDVAEVVEFILL